MKCPHCLTAFHDNPESTPLGHDVSSGWLLVKQVCPECRKFILILDEFYGRTGPETAPRYAGKRSFLCYPRAISRTPLPPEVPEAFASDYKEACLTLADSPKASATLSRRCLQNLLR